MTNFWKSAKFLLVIFLCLIFFGLGFYAGRDQYNIDVRKGVKITHQTTGKPKDVDFSLFWDVWNKVNEKYVGKTNSQEMMYGAISGMVNSLGDQYSVFMRPEDSQMFRSDLNGSFEGIGAEVALKDGKVVIVAPLEDSPAQKAGIKAQDVIVAIDGKSTDEMSLTQAVDLIRGKAGTQVTLTVLRSGETKTRDIKVTREKIVIKSVKWEMKANGVAYIKITQFGDDTSKLLKEALDEIKTKDAKSIIIDVRNNPGGLLSEAVDVTSMFIEPGVVVQRQSRDGHIDTDKTTLSPKMLTQKLIVLTNGGSASASEIFAGAIQDYKRGTLIGEKTFGKGSVQDLEPLQGGGALKITTAKWLTAKGRVVDGKGISPDIEVASPKDENNTADPQLDRALQEAQK